MAGAADGRGLMPGLGGAGTAPVVTGPARALAWRPSWIALALVAAALLTHVAIWGAGAPLGRAPWGGLAIAVLGVAWMAWAGWHLRAAGRLRFVDDGPYRFGRNPMHLGTAVAVLGLAAMLGAPSLVLAAAAFAAIVQRVHIPHEEAQLRAAFGGWYSDYAASVRRWF
ncbi:MAG: methyltransferase [Burkholderiaceae bacterium]